MNSSYEMSEATDLIEKLFQLTRNGKIQWSMINTAPRPAFVTRQYFTPLEGMLEASIWENNRAAGFRLFERRGEEKDTVMPAIAERDLVAISIEHDHDASLGPIYTMLMALLELARRAEDKVEPKVDRAKQYLDKLAV